MVDVMLFDRDIIILAAGFRGISVRDVLGWGLEGVWRSNNGGDGSVGEGIRGGLVGLLFMAGWHYILRVPTLYVSSRDGYLSTI